MDDKLKEYCGRLQEQVKLAETRLTRVREHLVSPEVPPLPKWRALLQEATNACAATGEQAQQAALRIKASMEDAQKRPRVPFDDSNLDGELVKAENQADREEGLALDAIVVASHAILQAEVAILQAFTTRKTASDLARFRDVF